MHSPSTRRRIAGSLLTVLAGLPALLVAQTPPLASTPIQHVVVIFQENVSFDHYFGTYPKAQNTTQGEPGFLAAANTPSVNGLNGPLGSKNPNSASPFRLTRAQAVTCDQDHNYPDEQKAFNSGLMNKFVEAVGVGSGSCDIGVGTKVVMGYYDGNTVTAFWNYAQNFAMSDNFFNTVFGPSTPGALNLVSGQTHGATITAGSATGNVTAGSVTGDPRPSAALDDCTIIGKTLVTMSGKNVGDLLNAKGLTWGWFQGGFKPSSRNADGTAICATAHNNVSGASAGADYIPHHQPFQYYQSTANPHHMPPSSVAKIGETDQANHQYDSSDFFAGLAAGVLPAVSYLKAPAYQDGHAGYSDPLDEQTFVVNTINTLQQSPFWSNTAVIITYDDSDGWYDHVIAPIVSSSATPDDNLTGAGACGDGTGSVYQGRCGYGPRLPFLVISPYARVNYVDHTTTDQSSVLRFIEDNWNLGRIGDNSFDAVAGSINGLFNFSAASAKPLYLDPAMGTVVAPPSAGGGTPSNQTTLAVANPKNATVTSRQFQLDGTASTAFDGGTLQYAWTLAPGSLPAAISGWSTATPTVQFGSNRGAYTFILTVTDSKGNTSTDTTTITYAGQ